MAAQSERKQRGLAEDLKGRGWRKKTFLFPAAVARRLAHRAVEEERTEKAIVLDALALYFDPRRS